MVRFLLPIFPNVTSHNGRLGPHHKKKAVGIHGLPTANNSRKGQYTKRCGLTEKVPILATSGNWLGGDDAPKSLDLSG
jgi:hypothetical protein